MNTENNQEEKNVEIIDTDNISQKLGEIEEISEIEEFTEELGNEENSEDFAEVLELTQYTDGSLRSADNEYVVAEYKDIDTTNLEKKHKVAAKSFVNQITKLILQFNDVELTKDHEKYIKQVAGLQVDHMSDMLYLVDVNKQMLNNILARVNVTQAEDYAIVNTYNNLANQHLKLIKELQNTYKSIPTLLKKTKTEISCNQELGEGNGDDGLITEEFGKSQFNNGKQLLKKLLDERQKKKLEENDPKIKHLNQDNSNDTESATN